MKRTILMSLLVIGAVVAVIVGATTAYFSDPETATGTFSAGTIDISVDGHNPWNGSFEMKDLKPSETGTIEFKIHNTGSNPVVVWKHIGDVATDTGVVTEPECEDEGGTWASDICTGNKPKDDIDTVTNYDLVAGSAVIFADADNLTIADIQSMWMPLGTIPGHGDLVVKQSYHMRGPDTGNWAQGDTMTFDIDLYAEQRLGPGPAQLSNKLFLDNKSGDPDWYFVADGTWGILTWGSSGELVAQGLESGTGYDLITYVEPWPGTVGVICSGTSGSDGKLSVSNCDPTAGYEGKIWLVLDSDNDGSQMTAWQPTRYLFESNLVDIEP